jgi:hypothetical protein
VKIDQISNSFNTDDKYQLIKIWGLAKERYNRAYGLTNKAIEAGTIISFLSSLVYGLAEAQDLPSAIQSILSIEREDVRGRQEGNLIITENLAENTIIVQKPNISGQPELYLRPLIVCRGIPNGGGYELLYSYTGEVGSFRQFLTGLRDKPVPMDRKVGRLGGKSDEEIFDKTGITTTDLNELVGYQYSTFNASVFAMKLTKKYSLTPYEVADTQQSQYVADTRRNAKEHTQYGMGIPKSQEPKLVPFGNICLYYPKLKYQNTISVRTHLGKQIGGVPNKKISAKLTSIILNLLEQIQPTHDEINRLSTAERHIYDRLINLGKLHKSLPQTTDKSVGEIKKRLKLLEDEIQIGNNSPQLKKEIISLLQSLRDFKCISQGQVNTYIKQNL